MRLLRLLGQPLVDHARRNGQLKAGRRAGWRGGRRVWLGRLAGWPPSYSPGCFCWALPVQKHFPPHCPRLHVHAHCDNAGLPLNQPCSPCSLSPSGQSDATTDTYIETSVLAALLSCFVDVVVTDTQAAVPRGSPRTRWARDRRDAAFRYR